MASKVSSKRRTLKTSFRFPCFPPVAKDGPPSRNSHDACGPPTWPWSVRGGPVTSQPLGADSVASYSSSLPGGKFHLDLQARCFFEENVYYIFSLLPYHTSLEGKNKTNPLPWILKRKYPPAAELFQRISHYIKPLSLARG